MITRRSLASLVSGGIAAAGMTARGYGADISPVQMSSIAEQAFIYDFPMVMNYGVWYQYFIDKSDPAYKAPFNQIYNTARVYTHEDTTIVTPNNDPPFRRSARMRTVGVSAPKALARDRCSVATGRCAQGPRW